MTINAAEHKQRLRHILRGRELGDVAVAGADLQQHAINLIRSLAEASAAQAGAGAEPPGHIIVAGYAPIKREVNCLPILASIQDVAQTALPVVVDRTLPLQFRAWAPGDALQAGAFDIPVPLDGAPWVTPDIMLLPLIGFDAAGYRLGMGGGFYDRTLADPVYRQAVTTIGLGYKAQQIDGLPHEAHDQPLDWIVTEEGSMSFAKERTA